MIEDQSTLIRALKEKHGILTHQVQVSRDLRRLGIGKKKVGDKMVYDLPESRKESELLRLAVLQVLHNESLIVVKTRDGLADFVGDYIDSQEDSYVLATLAGENVVFVSPKSIKNIQKTYENICKILCYKKSG